MIVLNYLQKVICTFNDDIEKIYKHYNLTQRRITL